jgi:hypothetical protein
MTSRRANRFHFLPLLGGALLVAGCGLTSDTSSSAPSAPQMGKLTVQLTDAPFSIGSVDRADIFVVRVEGSLLDAANSDAAPEDANDPSKGFVTIASPNASYNLMDLQNGTTANLGQATLPTGSYRSFRLILDTDASSVTLTDGTVLNGNSKPGIKWPSAGQTGIKIVLSQPIDVTENGTVMVLDFDLGHSFVLRGHTITQNGLLFKPVIRATAQDITGSVSGSVRADSANGDPVADATVEVLRPGTALDDTSPDSIVRSGTSDDTGAFTLEFVPPGTYELRAWPSSALADTYDPVLLSDVTVTTGVDNGGNVLILPRQTGSVSGSVRADSANGDPVAGATVEVLRPGTALDDTSPDSIVTSGTSDDTGAFTFASVPTGTYELRAWPPSALSGTYNPVLLSDVTVTNATDSGGNVLILPHQ